MAVMKKTMRRTSSKGSSRIEVKNDPRPQQVLPNGEPFKEFTTGAVRSTSVAGGITEVLPRYELVCPTALRRLAITMSEGASKYGEHNWTRGLPNSNSLNHALAHLEEYLAGDRSEDHLGHALANIQFIIHFNHDCGCQKGFELLEASNIKHVQPLKWVYFG